MKKIDRQINKTKAKLTTTTGKENSSSNSISITSYENGLIRNQYKEVYICMKYSNVMHVIKKIKKKQNKMSEHGT